MEEYTKSYELTVDIRYHPSSSKKVIPGFNEPKGDPYNEYTPFEIEDITLNLITDTGPVQITEDQLPAFVLLDIMSDIEKDIEERELGL